MFINLPAAKDSTIDTISKILPVGLSGDLMEITNVPMTVPRAAMSARIPSTAMACEAFHHV